MNTRKQVHHQSLSNFIEAIYKESRFFLFTRVTIKNNQRPVIHIWMVLEFSTDWSAWLFFFVDHRVFGAMQMESQGFKCLHQCSILLNNSFGSVMPENLPPFKKVFRRRSLVTTSRSLVPKNERLELEYLEIYQR